MSSSSSSHSSDNGFSFRERILVAPDQPTTTTTNTNPFLHVRLESSLRLSSKNTTTTTTTNSYQITPFPNQARDLLQRHQARRILIQVGTSASHSFGPLPLDAVDPWTTSSSSAGRRLDLGPSGVLVRVVVQVAAPTTTEGLTLAECQALEEGNDSTTTAIQRRIMEDWGAQNQIESLLQDLVAQRIVLAPLFSVSIRRLHRHSLVQVSCPKPPSPTATTITTIELDYELVLPMEGAALSSEGMHAFATTLAPCSNQSGIFSWNDPSTLSDILAVKRQSMARHSWWIQLEQEETMLEQTTTITSVTKGLQFHQPLSLLDYTTTAMLVQEDSDNSSKNRTVSLADVFPSSTRHRRCPFVQESTLETVVLNNQQQQVEMISNNKETMDDSQDSYSIVVQELTPQQWKTPWMTIRASPPSGNNNNNNNNQPQQQPKWSVHQTLKRPRGVAYAGQLVTQAVVHSSSSSRLPQHNDNNCHVSVDLQWFLPPVVQPTWQSLRVVWDNGPEQTEQELDWKHDLNGQIAWINGEQEQHHAVLPEDMGTLHFRIPHWNVTTTTHENASHTLTVSLDYRPAFLSFENFPGDANRGVEIPPAMATFTETCQPPVSSSSQPVLTPAAPILLYSSSLLLLPPVPDMSMPFNVLSMTCSLYAFIIGSLLNLLIRKSSERVQVTYDPSKVPPPNKVQQLKANLIAKVKSWKRGK